MFRTGGDVWLRLGRHSFHQPASTISLRLSGDERSTPDGVEYADSHCSPGGNQCADHGDCEQDQGVTTQFGRRDAERDRTDWELKWVVTNQRDRGPEKESRSEENAEERKDDRLEEIVHDDGRATDADGSLNANSASSIDEIHVRHDEHGNCGDDQRYRVEHRLDGVERSGDLRDARRQALPRLKCGTGMIAVKIGDDRSFIANLPGSHVNRR